MQEILTSSKYDENVDPRDLPGVKVSQSKPKDIRAFERFANINAGFADSTLKNIENSPLIGKRPLEMLSHNTATEKPRKQIKLADLFEGFRKGTLAWEQLTFSKETVEYLQKNLSTLLQDK